MGLRGAWSVINSLVQAQVNIPEIPSFSSSPHYQDTMALCCFKSQNVLSTLCVTTDHKRKPVVPFREGYRAKLLSLLLTSQNFLPKWCHRTKLLLILDFVFYSLVLVQSQDPTLIYIRNSQLNSSPHGAHHISNRMSGAGAMMESTDSRQ